jgi:uncharacterized membrane protein YsdA (DUF1294 family)
MGALSWLLAWLAAANVVTAVLYAYDKLATPRRWRRIRERTLWICCLAGGVLGAWLVFLGMRHKIRHGSFWVVQSLASAMWAAVLAFAVTR